MGAASRPGTAQTGRVPPDTPPEEGPDDLGALLSRLPEGWTAVAYRGRRYGLSRTSRAGGRSISVYAEELGGDDVVSTNVYRTAGGDLLRPCEMPAATVLAFLCGWSADLAVGEG